MKSQITKANEFLVAHRLDRAFIIPNPWDVGTARLLDMLGFKALATTGAGYAFSRGQSDNTVACDEMMKHLADIASATDLPVSADLCNGFGDDPRIVHETIRRAAEAGVVGGSIEDASGTTKDSLYSLDFSVERIRAASEAARSLSFPFTLTARAENYLVGNPDLRDTIKRLQAYQEAGANVLFAPGLTKKEDIASLVSSLDCPVNVIMGLSGVRLSLDDLSKIGVKRISVGGSLCRAALGAFLRAAHELKDHGTFDYADAAISSKDINAMFLRE